MVDIDFIVIGRTKSEKLKKGTRRIEYQVTLKSTQGYTLKLVSESPALLEKYPWASTVSVRIGKNAQRTFH